MLRLSTVSCTGCLVVFLRSFYDRRISSRRGLFFSYLISSIIICTERRQLSSILLVSFNKIKTLSVATVASCVQFKFWHRAIHISIPTLGNNTPSEEKRKIVLLVTLFIREHEFERNYTRGSCRRRQTFPQRRHSKGAPNFGQQFDSQKRSTRK